MKKILGVFLGLLALVGAAQAQLGSTTGDLVYTPLTPCRILDTRTASGGTGPILAGATRNVTV